MLFPEDAKVCTARNDPDAHGIDIDGVPMGSAAFKAARHEETPLEAAAAVIAGIDKALVSQGMGHTHMQAAFAMPRVCVYPRIWHLLRCAYPPDVHGYAKRFDERDAPERSRERAAGIAGGKAIEDDGNTGIVRDRISLPVVMGGWGMRQWADLAPVAFLAGAAAALPSFIDRRIAKHTGNKENGAGKGRGRGSDIGQNTSCTGSSSRRHEPQRRDLRSRLQHRYLPRTRSSAAHARAVAPGMFPHVGQGSSEKARSTPEGTGTHSKAPWVRSSTPRGPVQEDS